MMTRLIATALSPEMKVVKQCFGKQHDTDYLVTGMGNYQTIMTLTEHIMREGSPTEILFDGICGWSSERQSLVQVARVVNAYTGKENIRPVSKTVAPLVSVVSGESPFSSLAEMRDCHYADMESRWVAMVADRFQIPCTIWRVPIDEIGTSRCETFDREDALRQFAESIGEVAKSDKW